MKINWLNEYALSHSISNASVPNKKEKQRVHRKKIIKKIMRNKYGEKSNDYAEYIVENIGKYIDYAEYIAENIGKNIDYAEYLAENPSGFLNKKEIQQKTRKKIINNILDDNLIENNQLTEIDKMSLELKKIIKKNN